ncbi:permease [Thermobifida halotolerans]|uniref:Permease n=1 Tax=Thermobifida halotolerans TaxID=483545 RepID=A0A399G5Y6_9ACTN|nr:permease [Thermobifida halotolerans]UOE21656.1 permease [Thermobifida halotolerans]
MSERPSSVPASAPSLGDSLVQGWGGPDDDQALPPPEWGRPERSRKTATVWLFALLILVLAAGQALLAGRFTHEAFLAWATVFTAISLQALPFLVFGVALSAALTAFVPARFWQRAVPRRASLAVPVAGLSGAVLPGCECASVPVAGGLIRRGVAPAAALTFLLAAPAINPVVVVATVVAFPNQPEMALARFLASLAAAVVVGWLWAAFGRSDWLRPPRTHHDPDASGWRVFAESMRHDLMHAGGFLIVGALAAASVNVLVPREWVTAVADTPVVSVLAMAFLAVVLSICSEADAFVAVSFTEFSATAKLAFLVVGPMVDLKLIALQAGSFGWSFVRRFVPLTLALTLLFSFLIGGWLL